MNNLMRILKYLWPYKGKIALSFVFSIAIAIFSASEVSSLKPIFDLLFQKEDLSYSLDKIADKAHEVPGSVYFKEHVVPKLKGMLPKNPDGFTTDRKKMFMYLLLFLSVIIVLHYIFRFFQEYWTGWVVQRLTYDINSHLFRHVQQLSLRFFNETGVSQIISRFTNDVIMVNRGIDTIFGKAIREPLKAIGFLAVALMLSPVMTLITLVAFP
ncbi:MAG: hypothetical protein L7F78_27600, partial [Syntrophales bacterium LBB04]|nr:hypothetical protein [Syntrophales bacterium LBB04]